MSAVMKMKPKVATEAWIEQITPAKAKHYLLFNTTNRSQSQPKIIEYAMAMVDGRWVLNGETIKFDNEGTLIDGQNRLQACILADVPFTTYVIRGLEDKRAFATVDVGKSRSHTDMMSIVGIDNRYNLASAATLIIHYDNGTVTWRGASARRFTRSELGKLADKINSMPTRTVQIQKDQLIEWVGKHHDEIQPIVRKAQTHKKKNLVSPGVLAAACYIAARDTNLDVDRFIEDLCEGVNLDRNDPVHVLRERLIANATAKMRYNRYTIFGMILKMMKKRVRGEKCSVFRFSEDEPFPSL